MGLSKSGSKLIIVPSIRAGAREAAARMTAQEIYSTRREQLAADIDKMIREHIRTTLGEEAGSRVCFEVQPILIRHIELPARIKEAIANKLAADQDNQQMEFTLLKAKKEAERKKIEAEGIANFQKIVTEGISDKLLQWKGIEATLTLAESHNAKVVIIGNGKDGLPIILNTGKE